jgi:hypothetical protein
MILTFFKSDILHRHESIHTAPIEKVTSAGRKRACVHCARARERCTRGEPCSRCSTRSLQCFYPRDGKKLPAPPQHTPLVATEEGYSIQQQEQQQHHHHHHHLPQPEAIREEPAMTSPVCNGSPIQSLASTVPSPPGSGVDCEWESLSHGTYSEQESGADCEWESLSHGTYSEQGAAFEGREPMEPVPNLPISNLMAHAYNSSEYMEPMVPFIMNHQQSCPSQTLDYPLNWIIANGAVMIDYQSPLLGFGMNCPSAYPVLWTGIPEDKSLYPSIGPLNSYNLSPVEFQGRD